MNMNPFSRLRNELGLSQSEVAQRLDISAQTLLKLEQGLFKEPSERVMLFYINELGGIANEFTPQTLTNEYYDFQLYKRSLAKFRLPMLLAPVGFKLGPKPYVHPFTTWRLNVAGTSLAGFCKLLAYDPVNLLRYEQSFRFPRMPETLENVLMDAGIKYENVAALNDRVAAFIAYKGGRPVPSELR